MKRAKVGIVVDPDTWRDFRVECLKRGLPVADMIDAALKLMTKQLKQEKTK